MMLFVVARLGSGKGNNNAFFRADRKSPWWVVAFGMIGASLSGVSFISVPGMVVTNDMTYMQLCIGFFFGYLVVAFVLLPLYYKMNLTSIYTYLNRRFGTSAYQTGAWTFLISKLFGASVRLFLVCVILHRYVFDAIGCPFVFVVCGVVGIIWLYTLRGGIKSLVWTDALQTLCLIVALLMVAYHLCHLNGFTPQEAFSYISENPKSQWFVWSDWASPQHFIKQFLSGIFIVVVMTGLDQDMMQKNLTCKSLRDAQKDMCTYGFFFIPMNWLFLCVGVLMLTFVANNGITLPTNGDDILPMLCAGGYLGDVVLILFSFGVISAAFSSADSALTALTTSFCVDIMRMNDDSLTSQKLRKRVHTIIAFMMIVLILLFESLNNTSVIDAIYVMASYTYGPLLGLFSFGLFTKRTPRGRWLPIVCILSPLLCLVVDHVSTMRFNYHIGYELLLLNGFLTFCGLLVLSYNAPSKKLVKSR